MTNRLLDVEQNKKLIKVKKPLELVSKDKSSIANSTPANPDKRK